MPETDYSIKNAPQFRSNLRYVKNTEITIIPGHGDEDPGAVSGDLEEKKLAWLTARALQKELEAAGAIVYISRGGGVVPLDRLTPFPNIIEKLSEFFEDSTQENLVPKKDIEKIIKASNLSDEDKKALSKILKDTRDKNLKFFQQTTFANNKNAAINIGIHFNSSPSEKANGTYTYYGRNKDRVLAAYLNSSTLNALSHFQNKILPRHSTRQGDVFKKGFHILTHTKAPSVLMEMGFITGEVDQKVIKTDGFYREAAHGIAEGINRYFQSKSQSSFKSSDKIARKF